MKSISRCIQCLEVLSRERWQRALYGQFLSIVSVGCFVCLRSLFLFFSLTNRIKRLCFNHKFEAAVRKFSDQY